MITYSVAALLLAYFGTVETQATICLATYGGVATRYVSSLKLFLFELPIRSLSIVHFQTTLTSYEPVCPHQDEILSSKSAHI